MCWYTWCTLAFNALIKIKYAAQSSSATQSPCEPLRAVIFIHDCRSFARRTASGSEHPHQSNNIWPPPCRSIPCGLLPFTKIPSIIIITSVWWTADHESFVVIQIWPKDLCFIKSITVVFLASRVWLCCWLCISNRLSIFVYQEISGIRYFYYRQVAMATCRY